MKAVTPVSAPLSTYTKLMLADESADGCKFADAVLEAVSTYNSADGMVVREFTDHCGQKSRVRISKDASGIVILTWLDGPFVERNQELQRQANEIDQQAKQATLKRKSFLRHALVIWIALGVLLSWFGYFLPFLVGSLILSFLVLGFTI